MAPVLEVNVRDLDTVTEEFVDVTRLLAAVKQYSGNATVASGNWPMAGWDAKAAYSAARSIVEEASGAARGGGEVIARSINTVARHYNEAEDNSIITARPPRISPRPHSASEKTGGNKAIAWDGYIFAGGGVTALIVLASAGGMLKAISQPLGVVSLIMIADLMFVQPNVREPGPFREARDTWRIIADNIKPTREHLEKTLPLRSWEGAAASAFNKHMTTTWLPALQELESLARSMEELCNQVAAGLDRFNKIWLENIIGAVLGLIIGYAFPPGIRFYWAVLMAGSYLGRVAGLAWDMYRWFSTTAATSRTVQSRAGVLARQCFDNSQVLEDRRNRLRPQFIMVSKDWTDKDWTANWRKT